MGTIAAMAVAAIITTIISVYASKSQQTQEYWQQQQLQEDQQEFTAQQADLAYERNKPSSQYADMLEAGFNPVLAASSIMGTGNTSPASAVSSPSVPTTNSAIGALSSMLGQGGQNLYDMFKNNAEIENIQANTSKTEVETGLLPRDYMLRNLSVTKQLEAWDASIKRTKAAQQLDEEQTKLIQNQNLYYGRMSEAQLKAYQAQIAQAYSTATNQLEQAKTEENKRRNLDTQSALNVANTELAHDESRLVSQQVSTEYYKGESARIAQEFEKKLGDIPLTVDAQKYVQGLVKNGDIDGIKNFYSNILQTALNQQYGEEMGSSGRFGLPFNLYQGRPNSELNGYGWRSTINAPLWNMIHDIKY